jgi:hypothetical protein
VETTVRVLKQSDTHDSRKEYTAPCTAVNNHRRTILASMVWCRPRLLDLDNSAAQAHISALLIQHADTQQVKRTNRNNRSQHYGKQETSSKLPTTERTLAHHNFHSCPETAILLLPTSPHFFPPAPPLGGFFAKNSLKLSSSHLTSSLLSPGPTISQHSSANHHHSRIQTGYIKGTEKTHHQPNVPKSKETPSTPRSRASSVRLRSRNLRVLIVKKKKTSAIISSPAPALREILKEGSGNSYGNTNPSSPATPTLSLLSLSWPLRSHRCRVLAARRRRFARFAAW